MRVHGMCECVSSQSQKGQQTRRMAARQGLWWKFGAEPPTDLKLTRGTGRGEDEGEARGDSTGGLVWDLSQALAVEEPQTDRRRLTASPPLIPLMSMGTQKTGTQEQGQTQVPETRRSLAGEHDQGAHRGTAAGLALHEPPG